MRIIQITLIIVLVSVVALAAFVLGIYKLDWDGPTSKKFSQIIPLPIAVVGGKLVSLSDFWKLEKGDSEVVVQNLIRDKIVEILAKERNIDAGPSELETYYLYLQVKFGLNKDQAQGEITQLFGITEQDFKSLVVLPDLRLTKLRLWWQETNRPNAASNRTNEAEKKLSEGLTFQETARVYSDHKESKYIGGDLGFLRLEEIPPWFRQTVENLKTGDMSRVVVGPDGYYIFQIATRGQDPAQNEIQIRQIFIRNEGFEEFLEEQTARFRILVFKKI